MSSDKIPAPQYDGLAAPLPAAATPMPPTAVSSPSGGLGSAPPPQYQYSSGPEAPQQSYQAPPQQYAQQYQYAAPAGYRQPNQQGYQPQVDTPQYYGSNQGYVPPNQNFQPQHQQPGQYYGYPGQAPGQHPYGGSPYAGSAYGYNSPPAGQNAQVQHISGSSVVVVRPQTTPFPHWRVIMLEGLFGCADDCGSFALACCVPSCMAGHNQGRIGKNCFFECLFYPCFAGCQRSTIQMVLGVPDSGCCLNCCLHYHCGACALAQETRALDAWIIAGRPPAVPSAVIVSV